MNHEAMPVGSAFTSNRTGRSRLRDGEEAPGRSAQTLRANYGFSSYANRISIEHAYRQSNVF